VGWSLIGLHLLAESSTLHLFDFPTCPQGITSVKYKWCRGVRIPGREQASLFFIDLNTRTFMETIYMSLVDFSRKQARKLLTKENNMILENRIPSYESLEKKFQDISEFGLYLHIPWHFVWPGAVVATVLFEIARHFFAFYIEHFGGYQLIYGSLGAIVILLVWIYYSAFIMLLGAEVGSELNHLRTRPEPNAQSELHAPLTHDVNDKKSGKDVPIDK